jgi:hypothetical protein
MPISKKHILLSIATILILLVVTGFLLATRQSTMPPILPPLTSQRSGTSSLSNAVGTSTEGINDKATSTHSLQHYLNEEWGFEFWYPEGFVVREKDFTSHYSKFNLYVLDKVGNGFERAFLVNIVLPKFAEQSFSGLDKKTKEIVIDGVPGVEYEYKFSERSEKMTILPFGEFRMILGLHYEEYDDLYNQILGSFKFLK